MVRIQEITMVAGVVVTVLEADFPEQVEGKEEVQEEAQEEEWAAEEVEAWVAEWDTDQAVSVSVRHVEP